MDKIQFHQCAEMVDEVDLLISKSRTKTGSNGKPLILSCKRKTGPRSELFLQKKLQLLATMRALFIEPRIKSLRISALLVFCHEHGFTLATYQNKTHIRASFTVRTPGFDLVVASDD